MADSDSKYKIITEDFNEKNGTKTKEDVKSMGAFGIGERNKRGDRLIEFAEEHKLSIANTLFQKQKPKSSKPKQNRYLTLESPERETRNQRDLVLSNQRGLVTNCEVITKDDIRNDHRLVRMALRVNKRLAGLKAIKKQNLFNINSQTLKGMKGRFEINLKKQSWKTWEGVTASNVSEIMKEEAKTLAGKTKKKETPVLPSEDQEIKQLEERREKKLRKKENRSERDKIDIRGLRKLWKRSADKDHKRNEQVMLKIYFKVVEDQNRYTKDQNRNEKWSTDRNQILKLCEPFYTELYSSTLQDRHPSLIPAQTR